MRSTERTAYFERIYATDLRYVPDCYKLCGDAHCCNFSRYKQKFAFMGRSHFQELPLLPGEFEFLRDQGYLAQFQDHELRQFDFDIAQGTIRYSAIVSRREGCACNNATRPTICRLYPLFPQFDERGALIGMEDVGIYEELERIEGLPRACQIDRLPVGEMKAFVELVSHIGGDPVAAFHMEAFRRAKRAAAKAVENAVGDSGKSAFRSFEMLMMRSKLFDIEGLRAELEGLAARFVAVHGARFQL